MRVKHVFGHVVYIGEVGFTQPGNVDGLQFLACELLAVLAIVASHENAVGVQRNVEGIGHQAEDAHGYREAGVIDIQADGQVVHAVIEHDNESIGGEDLADDGNLVAMGVKAVHSGGRRNLNHVGNPVGRLLRDSLRLRAHSVVAEFEQMLGRLGVAGVEFEGMSEGGAG